MLYKVVVYPILQLGWMRGMSVATGGSEEQSLGARTSLALPMSQSHFLKLQLVINVMICYSFRC